MADKKILVLSEKEQKEQELDPKYLNPHVWYICGWCGRKQMVGWVCTHEGNDLDDNDPDA